MAELKKKSIWEAYRFSIILLGAIFLGSLIGIQFGEKAKVLKPLGDLFINGMFTIVVPLVLVTISSSISSMSDMKRLKSVLKNLFLVFVSTGFVAAIIILVIVTVFPPAQGVNLSLKATEALKPF
jgi:Na+/H+-dicarboxylate symporter